MTFNRRRGRFEGAQPMRALLLLLISVAACCVGACETVVTHAELAAGRSRGVEFFGAFSSGQLGLAVNSVGDVNGDGFEDVALAAPYESNGIYTSAGAVYVVFGRSAEAWANASFDFSASTTPDPASWIRIRGSEANKYLGQFGIEKGDFNGDGLGDILLGTQSAFKAFCVFGHSGTWSSFSTSEIESGAVPGFAIMSGVASTANLNVGNAGDMNGDGIEDLLVSVYDGSSTIAATVVFGESGATRSTFDLSTVNGANGFSLTDGSTFLGRYGAMGSAGDVNGDGLADLAVGAYALGRAYILFARNVTDADQWPSPIDLTSFLGGTTGFIVEGPASSQFGWTVVGAGDVNSDGFADTFIGSNSASGEAWIVFGHPAPWTSPLDASQLNGTDGFHFASPLPNEFWGVSGGSAGDFNGDGFGDIIIGGLQGKNSTGYTTGAAAILFGHNGTWPAELGPADAVGTVGFLIDGPDESSFFGCSARGAGDVNGDGLADVVVGANYYLSSQQGYAALVFGVADDHCAVCSNTTDECLACDDGFILNGTTCKAAASLSSSSSEPASQEGNSASSSVAVSSSSSSQDGSSASSSSGSSTQTAEASSAAVIVVIETGGGSGSAIEVAAEVAQLLGVDVGQISVVEITPGIFEVTVTNKEVALQLVTLITQCMEDASSGQ